MSFPDKLFSILEREDQSVMGWILEGSAFKVFDNPRFCEIILPKYYRHNKIESFQRQLNMYGFKRVSRGEDIGAYFHPMFIRGKRHLLRHVKRVSVSASGQADYKSNAGLFLKNVKSIYQVRGGGGGVQSSSLLDDAGSDFSTISGDTSVESSISSTYPQYNMLGFRPQIFGESVTNDPFLLSEPRAQFLEIAPPLFFGKAELDASVNLKPVNVNSFGRVPTEISLATTYAGPKSNCLINNSSRKPSQESLPASTPTPPYSALFDEMTNTSERQNMISSALLDFANLALSHTMDFDNDLTNNGIVKVPCIAHCPCYEVYQDPGLNYLL